MVRDHHNRLICRIDVMGLAAIFFVLFYIFANPQLMWYRRSAPVEMAHVTHPSLAPRADREDAVIIAVARDGKVYFGARQVLPGELPGKIRAAVAAGADPRAYIRADQNVKYAAVKDVLDEVRDAKLQRVTFLVEQRRTPSSAEVRPIGSLVKP